ncbi:hypothetical protein GQX74_010708 [Glossina fuscipes]|nr:hypothetical protein GQX74_010708 [Glossina fuscipes]
MKFYFKGGESTLEEHILTSLNISVKQQYKPIPAVAIMPLGNDLSRVLNWGSERPSILDRIEILNNIYEKKTRNFFKRTFVVSNIPPLIYYASIILRHFGGDELQAHDEASDRSDQNKSNGALSVQIHGATLNDTLLTTLLLIFTSKLIIS